jgi:hypothetical protein
MKCGVVLILFYFIFGRHARGRQPYDKSICTATLSLINCYFPIVPVYLAIVGTKSKQSRDQHFPRPTLWISTTHYSEARTPNRCLLCLTEMSTDTATSSWNASPPDSPQPPTIISPLETIQVDINCDFVYHEFMVHWHYWVNDLAITLSRQDMQHSI